MTAVAARLQALNRRLLVLLFGCKENKNKFNNFFHLFQNSKRNKRNKKLGRISCFRIRNVVPLQINQERSN